MSYWKNLRPLSALSFAGVKVVVMLLFYFCTFESRPRRVLRVQVPLLPQPPADASVATRARATKATLRARPSVVKFVFAPRYFMLPVGCVIMWTHKNNNNYNKSIVRGVLIILCFGHHRRSPENKILPFREPSHITTLYNAHGNNKICTLCITRHTSERAYCYYSTIYIIHSRVLFFLSHYFYYIRLRAQRYRLYHAGTRGYDNNSEIIKPFEIRRGENRRQWGVGNAWMVRVTPINSVAWLIVMRTTRVQ